MFKGVLRKMLTSNGSPIRYFLTFENDFLEINQCIGRKLNIKKTGEICINCYERLNIFRQGFCKSCFFNSPNSGEWIIRPELSTAHLGVEDRDLEYEKKIQLVPHIVYLSLSSHLKVGVTRKEQLITRWIDQGAKSAISILDLPNRYMAGIAEQELKKVFSDKTNWRKMLQNDVENVDWKIVKDMAFNNISNDLKPYFIKENNVTELLFPVDKHPKKVSSLNLSKSSYQGLLTGVKGQYLIFEDDTVFNVRGNEGTEVFISID
tara:strand:- start:1651 stop:2439 length:789 start_codon:yes stop_codon:yes gene_type:complete